MRFFRELVPCAHSGTRLPELYPWGHVIRESQAMDDKLSYHLATSTCSAHAQLRYLRQDLSGAMPSKVKVDRSESDGCEWFVVVVNALLDALIAVRGPNHRTATATKPLCVESDQPSSQTFHSSERRHRGFFCSFPTRSMTLRVVTENR